MAASLILSQNKGTSSHSLSRQVPNSPSASSPKLLNGDHTKTPVTCSAGSSPDCPVSRFDWRRRERNGVTHGHRPPGSPHSSPAAVRSSMASKVFTIDVSQRSWIEKTFQRRECIKFIPSLRDPYRCACGRNENWHLQNGARRADPHHGNEEKWHPFRHTEQHTTDAFGTIEFQGGPHPSKAQYIRLSSLDTRQENVLALLLKHWGLDLPKLLITVHGGILNFDLQPKLKRVFRKGLLKAARTTGAWIVTNGTNTGVTKHVGDAISDRTTKARNKVVAIGITPWGIVENKEALVGKDKVVPYHCVSSAKTNSSVLNSNHSYFVLVDNGTVGKYGGEILFRKKFEKYIAQQKIRIGNDFRGHGVPVICVVLEGGANTIRSVLEYVTDTPPVPVVVCDGSGRAADLLAFTHKYTMDDGTMPESLRDQLTLTIQRTFMYSQEQAEKLFIELMLCVKKKELITVFRMGDREDSKDIDLAILTALLKGTTASAVDQLNLALTWDRVDIARSHIFVYGQEWPEGALEVAMMDALINDRVDFVKLLLENGVSMHTFLTIPRLEDLYNARQCPSNSLRYLIADVKKHIPFNYRYTLPDIGLVLQLLMSGGFRSSYCRKQFRQKYQALKHIGTSVSNIVTKVPHILNTKQAEELFPYPFHDLMIWAVLMKRQKMALFMWQHGEEALAKALIAGKLYAAMAHEAEQDDLEIELTEEFQHYADEFLGLALELLGHCYKIDDDYTQQLLTYELKNFSEQTCLSLAVMANHRKFIAHTCCQMLLNDLWIGGLRMRKNSTLKVILGIIFPPYLFVLDFKSKEELQLMPQTMEEHLDELEDAASVADVSFSEEDQAEDGNCNEDPTEPISSNNTQIPAKENGTPVYTEDNNMTLDSSMFSHNPFHKKKSPLRMGKKVYEFYNAPITKFWSNALGYLLFLSLYIYVIIDRLKTVPTWAEVYVIAFMFTLAAEKVREIIASEPVNIIMKLSVYISNVWNVLDTVGIGLFAVGVVMRFIPATLNDAQLIYCVDIIFWNIRILEIYSVHKYLGPFVKIMGKLLRDMCYFLTILFIPVTSYGIVRQTVLYQNKEVSWALRLRNIWYYPYWNIYGELFAEEIDPCDLEANRNPDGSCNVHASWLAPACMTIFMLVANILMVNLLIARFNATFIINNANSKEIWMFQRYALILKYEMRPILPPPFILITHIFLAYKYIKRRCKGKRDFYDNGLKLFLSHEDTEKLHDFEEECMEDLYREKDLKHQNSSEERLKFITERIENISLRLDDINMKENHIQITLAALDHHMGRLDGLEGVLSDSVKMVRNLGRQHRLLNDEIFEETESDLINVNIQTGEKTSGSFKRKTPLDKLQRLTSHVNSRLMSETEFNEDDIDQFVGENDVSIDRESSSENTGSAQFYIGGEKLRENSLHKAISSSEEKNNPVKVSTAPAELVLDEGKQGGDSNPSNTEPTSDTAHIGDSSDEKPETVEVIQPVNGEQIELILPPEPTFSVSSTVSPNSVAGSNLRSRRRKNSGNTQPLTLNTTAAIVPSSMPQSSACFTTSYPDVMTGSAVRDLTFIFTPLIGEYTSITDNIDTSCLIDCSPPCSPGVTSSSMLSPGEVYQEERSAADSKQLQLKQAEEMEHHRMGSIIRHRLRQISQDERGSMSDIAKVVVAEMALKSQKQASEEEYGSEEASVVTEDEAADLVKQSDDDSSSRQSFQIEEVDAAGGRDPASRDSIQLKVMANTTPQDPVQDKDAEIQC
ncbi:transient receptor potential cation channel subfamily M member 1-like [Physella acuta]|uniref:transient receptor potential cation channel subfamily M member 1-like n=1 Tax=Physella acuta TaxID=109671 RepID=UPI0027DE674D|nr:transient receptor potential cation channel subfamily M member 1-like [Physella acuta]